MSGPGRMQGARALLFERLAEAADGADPAPGRAYGRDGVIRSIAGELERLLNTRAPVPARELAGRRRSTVDYGIPDLSAFPLPGADAVAELTRHVAQAIAAYEPRLLDPQVSVEAAADRAGSTVVVIRGGVALGDMAEPVAFRVPLDLAPARDDAD